MTLSELKEHLYDIAAEHFSGYQVIWGQANAVRPGLPYATLRVISDAQSTHPNYENDGGALIASYPSRAVLEVNVFTVTAGDAAGAVAQRPNTALDALNAFAAKIGSPQSIAKLYALDIGMLPMGGARDLSGLVGGNAWEYRAMAEFECSYTQYAYGENAAPDMAGAVNGWFESVEITRRNT